MEKSEVAKVFDTILSIPGMNELVKVDFKISRKNVLLLTSVIERGLHSKGEGPVAGLLDNLQKENLTELKAISDDCLQKAGLTELNDKLKALKV